MAHWVAAGSFADAEVGSFADKAAGSFADTAAAAAAASHTPAAVWDPCPVDCEEKRFKRTPQHRR